MKHWRPYLGPFRSVDGNMQGERGAVHSVSGDLSGLSDEFVFHDRASQLLLGRLCSRALSRPTNDSLEAPFWSDEIDVPSSLCGGVNGLEGKRAVSSAPGVNLVQRSCHAVADAAAPSSTRWCNSSLFWLGLSRSAPR